MEVTTWGIYGDITVINTFNETCLEPNCKGLTVLFSVAHKSRLVEVLKVWILGTPDPGKVFR
jgi:hypothetical protein